MSISVQNERTAFCLISVRSGARLLAFLAYGRACLDDRLLDIAQLVFAEEHFPTNRERWRAEGTAIDRVLRQFQQTILHVLLLRAREQPVEIDVRRHERLARDL